MERKQTNELREQFKEGFILILQKWSSFRITLDNNPQILTYVNDDNVLEINEMLETLYDDILETISKNKASMSTLVSNVSDCLFGFIQDYFQVDLDDESDTEVANMLIRLYIELQQKKDTYLGQLRLKSNTTKSTYSIYFPIKGEQKVVFEKYKDNEKEDDNDDDDEYEECDDDDDDEEDDDKVESKGKSQNDINDKERQTDNKKMDEDEDDGFIEIKKKKKGF